MIERKGREGGGVSERKERRGREAREGKENEQSLRVAMSLKGARKLRSAFVTVRRSNVCVKHGVSLRTSSEEKNEGGRNGRTAILQGFVTTALRSTVSTRGSLSAISLMHE